MIEFTSPEPSQPTNTAHDSRLLSFSMYNVQLQQLAGK
jgi:hypothetical protein